MNRTTDIQRVGAVLLVAAVASVSVIAGAAALCPETVLVVEDTETGERYVEQPVENGTTIGLEYTHSVERSPVYDEYLIEGTTLVNTRMEFHSYGWGLPAGADVANVNGTLVYAPPEPIMELETLSVSTGRIANHTLIVDGRRYDLVSETNASDVRIHVERQGLTDRCQ